MKKIKKNESKYYNYCATCGKKLPQNYTHKNCEYCQAEAAGGVRAAGLGIAGVLAAGAAVVVSIILRK